MSDNERLSTGKAYPSARGLESLCRGLIGHEPEYLAMRVVYQTCNGSQVQYTIAEIKDIVAREKWKTGGPLPTGTPRSKPRPTAPTTTGETPHV